MDVSGGVDATPWFYGGALIVERWGVASQYRPGRQRNGLLRADYIHWRSGGSRLVSDNSTLPLFRPG